MEILNSIAAFLNKLFQWWFTVMPWEQALLIRRGKRIKQLPEGFYFKIPFIDIVYIQSTRMRMIDIAVQTVSTKDNMTITIKSAVGYAIENISILYNTLSHPEMTLGSIVMGHIGECVREIELKDLTPATIECLVNKKLHEYNYGLKDITVRITSFAYAKTFRLIQDQTGLWESLNMEPKK